MSQTIPFERCAVCGTITEFTFRSWRHMCAYHREYWGSHLDQHPEFRTEGIPMRFRPKAPFCHSCWCMAEYEFVTSMPFEDMPLWVSHPWVSEPVGEHFRKRFSRGR